MNSGESSEILAVVNEIRDLLRLMAEPAIAERDRKLRDELRKIAGKSLSKAKVVMLMDGSRTKVVLHRETGFNQGNLTTLVKELQKAKLLDSGDGKTPKLAIAIPANFFESSDVDD
jgi:hypothetical protein